MKTAIFWNMVRPGLTDNQRDLLVPHFDLFVKNFPDKVQYVINQRYAPTTGDTCRTFAEIARSMDKSLAWIKQLHDKAIRISSGPYGSSLVDNIISGKPPVVSITESDNIQLLGLSSRAMKIMRNGGIVTIGELIQKSEGEVLHIRDCGGRIVAEIKRKLNACGFSLRKNTRSAFEAQCARIGISHGVYRALKSASIDSIDTLKSKKAWDLHRIHGLGWSSLKEIRQALARIGASLSGERIESTENPHLLVFPCSLDAEIAGIANSNGDIDKNTFLEHLEACAICKRFAKTVMDMSNWTKDISGAGGSC
ncbi:MAG: DNA-directed RNA polymerase subunit alpha C-terminal domain-containing protein [Syntrophobacteraceae bacterium]